MKGAARRLAFLDASVPYPALLRNILMYLALNDLFQASWSEAVQDEWTRALMRDRPDLPRAAVERRRRLMDENVHDASVIVTANPRDFPAGPFSCHGIAAQHPDAFILDLFKAAPDEVVAALRDLRDDLKNPPLTAGALLAAMSRNGLSASAEALIAFEGEL